MIKNYSTKEEVPKQYMWGEHSWERFLKSLIENERGIKIIEVIDTTETINLLFCFSKTVTEIARKSNESKECCEKGIRLV